MKISVDASTIVKVEANKWILEPTHTPPERMPNVSKLYKAGASYVGVAEYSKTSRRMVLDVTFPRDLAKAGELWLCVANCQHDGIKQVTNNPVRIQILSLSSFDYKYKIENGPYGGLTEW